MNRRRVTFARIGAPIHEYPILMAPGMSSNSSSQGQGSGAIFNPDTAWARLHQAIWNYTNLWLDIDKRLTNPAESRLLRQFMTEWNQGAFAAASEVGRTLRGAAAQKRATVTRIAQMTRDALVHAIKLNLPVSFSREEAPWLYEINPPPTQAPRIAAAGIVGSSADDPRFSAYRLASMIVAQQASTSRFVLVQLRSHTTLSYLADDPQEAYTVWGRLNLAAVDGIGRLVYAALYENENLGGTGKPRRLREFFADEG